MTNLAIDVVGLSKQYRIGQMHSAIDTLRDHLVHGLRTLRAGRTPRELIWALDDVSFEVREGEVLGIIGRNGAGKSTLLKILSRITEPTRGYADVYGRVGSLLEVGTGFHPELTGRENVYLSGTILGMTRTDIARRFDDIIAFAELDKFVDTPVKRYSSGMYMRLAFSVAAHLEPDVLLVDEVLAVGDAAFQQKSLDKMGDLVRGGRTVLFVSHNMGAVANLCSRVLHLHDGRIRALGSPTSVLAGYLQSARETDGGDLARFRSPGEGDLVRLTSIELSTPPDRPLAVKDALVYHLKVESDITLEGLSIGSSIFTSFGGCIGTFFTRETFSVRAGRQVALIVSVPNVDLAPGSYYASFSVGRG